MVGLLDVTNAELVVDSNSDDELIIAELVLSAMILEDPKVTDELGRTVVVGMDGNIDEEDMTSLFPISGSIVLLSLLLDSVTFSGSIVEDVSDKTVVALDAELELIDCIGEADESEIDEDSMVELERVETEVVMTAVLEDIASELVSLRGMVVGTGEIDLVEVIIELDIVDVLVPGRPFQLSVPVNVDVGSTELEDIANAEEVTRGTSDVTVVENELKPDFDILAVEVEDNGEDESTEVEEGIELDDERGVEVITSLVEAKEKEEEIGGLDRNKLLELDSKSVADELIDDDSSAKLDVEIDVVMKVELETSLNELE